VITDERTDRRNGHGRKHHAGGGIKTLPVCIVFIDLQQTLENAEKRCRLRSVVNLCRNINVPRIQLYSTILTNNCSYFTHCVHKIHSQTIFTARRVCIARIMSWQDVCPSVRPSHAGILSKWLHISSTFFHHRVAHHSSFSTPNGIAIFRRGPHPLTGASNAWGMKKITIFNHQYLALSRKECKTEP